MAQHWLCQVKDCRHHRLHRGFTSHQRGPAPQQHRSWPRSPGPKGCRDPAEQRQAAATAVVLGAGAGARRRQALCRVNDCPGPASPPHRSRSQRPSREGTIEESLCLPPHKQNRPGISRQRARSSQQLMASKAIGHSKSGTASTLQPVKSARLEETYAPQAEVKNGKFLSINTLMISFF